MRRSGTSFAVMMVDLDHFKNVNDTLGHAVGDALLVQVADRLSTPLRSGDTLCRLGGDEFTVLCENLQTPADAAQLAERLSRVFLKPFDLHPHSVYSAISIGISVSEPDSNPEGMLRDADTALYAAKRGGRGRTAWYNEQLHVEAETRFTLENAMRDALRTGRGFDVAFQSIVDLHTGEVVAIEALARWSHETLGKVPPAQFIPLAESAGLVPSLDLRVLDRALVELTERRAVSPSLRLHVNVSGRTLNSARFERELMQRVDKVDLLPVDITLEILETALLTPAGVGAVERLQQNGFRIALDDFGAGGSSLNHFLTFDADVLKIDRSFIAAAAAGNRRAVSVVRLVAKAGADLGMSVIAEGVEAQAELDMCLELGVRQAQGFLWGVM
jgi:diguanylate cyclase (GGDEF)-like protein